MAVTGTGRRRVGHGPVGESGVAVEVRVDTSFTRIYRFLRVLVRGLNRLLFRTTVEGPTRCRPRAR